MELYNYQENYKEAGELAPVLEAAMRAALAAGKVIRALYEKEHDISLKGEIDLVTEADVAAEKTILSILKDSGLDASFLAEESSVLPQTMPHDPLWIIDPLDGTTNFAHGFPWFAVSICYASQQQCRVGVIYQPLSEELFWAWKGGGAWLNGRKISVSSISPLASALVGTGFPYDVRQRPAEVMKMLGDVIVKARGIRRAGAAALDLAYVACGRLDGFWEIKLKPWDTAAGLVLVEEAGGKITNFAGEKFSPFMVQVLASNPLIHEELRRIVRGEE